MVGKTEANLHENPRLEGESRYYGNSQVLMLTVTMRTTVTFLCLFGIALSAQALSSLRGTAVQVTSGNNLTVSSLGQTYRVRLAEIDAPERGQAYADESRESLSILVLGKDIEVIVIRRDRNGRLVGRVFAGMVDVNAELVRRGLAWVNPKTVRDPVLVELEKIARREKRGLWHDPNAIPPWDWRRGKRQV